MTWYRCQEGWVGKPVPMNECNLGHLVEGMTTNDAPTGPMSIVMACIIRYCNLKTVVELGVHKGGTTVFLADAVRDTGGVCFAIDKDPCHEARERLQRLGLAAPHCFFLHGKTNEVGYYGNIIDLLFIDAGHGISEIASDWNRWVPLVRSGGWVFIDNAHSEEGVQDFLKKLKLRGELESHWQYIIIPESFGMAILRKL